jgi:hypothetical protein
MFAGRREVALDAAAALEAALPEELLRVRAPPMADWLESFVPMRLRVLVRFGMWTELIAEPLPEDQALYCLTTAFRHYAKGVALAATGQVASAHEQQWRLKAATARAPELRYLFNNTALDILAIAAAMLDGEIGYREGDREHAWSSLQRAIELDDTLPYDEPWGWMQPTRHAHGALLLEQGEVRRVTTGQLPLCRPRGTLSETAVGAIRQRSRSEPCLRRRGSRAAHAERLPPSSSPNPRSGACSAGS